MTQKKTIKDVSELWKMEKKQYVKASTYAAYLLILENHIIPSFGNAADISENDVQTFVFEKLKSGLCQQTVQSIIIVLKMIVRYGAKFGCDWNTEWDIRYPTVQKPKELEVLSRESNRKIMHYIQQNFTFKNIGIYICLSCGLRIGEVCALTWSDIDINEGVIRVRKTLERVYDFDGGRKKTHLVVEIPKTKHSVRNVPIPSSLMKMLRPLIRVVNGEFYVLSNETKPIEPRVYRNYYNSLMDKIGVPKIKFHGLRHSFATRCIESNCDYKTVSVLLGHANIGTTLNLYVHPNMEQKKKCIDKALKFLK